MQKFKKPLAGTPAQEKLWKNFIQGLKARVAKKSRNADGTKKEPILKRKAKR